VGKRHIVTGKLGYVIGVLLRADPVGIKEQVLRRVNVIIVKENA